MEVTEGPVNVLLYNGLFNNISSCFYYPITSEGPNLTCQNITVHNCGAFAEGQDGYSLEDDYDVFFVSIVNGLFVGTSLSARASTNYTAVLASDAGIFQTVGGASHYLAADSPYRNVGTTDIDAGLLADIAQKTTYPPIVYSNVTIAASTKFFPQAQRDSDIPDLGYHYDPLDYAFELVFMTNAIVQFQSGTAVGEFGSYGMTVCGGAQLISQGTPTSLNHFTRYNLVQECSNTNWAGSGDLFRGNFKGGSVTAQATFRFTDFSQPALDGDHLLNAYNDTTVIAQDCQFHGGKLDFAAYNFCLTNCLLERVASTISDNVSDMYPFVRNCTFYYGSLYLDDFDGTTWTFRDNLFDNTSITELDNTVDAAYNGYVPGSGRITTNVDDVVTNIVFETGPLGDYYLTNTSPFIDAGSAAANLVGLYQYTTQTNQTKETTSPVDIGFHYVAVDGNGNPTDYDGDGIPDYLEDLNGNGLVDSGETDWQSANDMGLKVLITRPKANSVLP